MRFEIIEEHGMFVLYSIVDVAFGGSAKNYIAIKPTRKEIEDIRDAVMRLVK